MDLNKELDGYEEANMFNHPPTSLKVVEEKKVEESQDDPFGFHYDERSLSNSPEKADSK